jgi:hypothetical protein
MPIAVNVDEPMAAQVDLVRRSTFLFLGTGACVYALRSVAYPACSKRC